MVKHRRINTSESEIMQLIQGNVNSKQRLHYKSVKNEISTLAYYKLTGYSPLFRLTIINQTLIIGLSYFN